MTIERIVESSVHVALGIGRPATHVRHGEVDSARAAFQIVHPEAIPSLVLVPPATLILHPVAAATVAEQYALTIVVDVHFVVAPPAKRLQWTPDKPFCFVKFYDYLKYSKRKFIFMVTYFGSWVPPERRATDTAPIRYRRALFCSTAQFSLTKNS